MRDKGKQTKESIMQAAVVLFAEKGFDGAGIRELAERAGITKSLLYYHFRNKEAILHELIREVFQDMETVFQEILHTAAPGKWDFQETVQRLEALFRNRREAVRIVFSVALRTPKVRLEILQQLIVFQSKTQAALEGHGIEIKNREKMLMERFFFGFGPFFLFLFFREEWIQTSGMTPEASRDLFRSLMGEQVAFHGSKGWA